MKEYCIYIRNGNAKPYRLKYYDSMFEAKKVLLEMVRLEEERERPYYVDNDFFQNNYNLAIKLKYFRLEEREVSEWKRYTIDKRKDKNNNILFIKDFVN